MARTKQTARRTTGSGYRASFQGTTEVIEVTPTGARTIAVNGEAEFEVPPDLIALNFNIEESAGDPLEATEAAIGKLGEIRKKLVELGVENQHISSDALVLQEISEEDEDENPPIALPPPPRLSFPTFPTNAPPQSEKKKKKKASDVAVTYEAHIGVHIALEGETAALFGKVMITLLASGLQQAQNPVYDLVELTAFRNDARRDAMKNASEKAAVIVEGLQNPQITLGAPLVIRDLMVNLEVVAPSFGGIFSTFRTLLTPRSTVMTTKAVGTNKKRKTAKEDEVAEATPPSTDARMEALLAQAEYLFVPPMVKVAARIQTLFELVETK